MKSAVRRVMLDPEHFSDPPAPFKHGSAGFVRFGPEGEADLEPRVQISANSAHALIGHGVVDALNTLGLEGTIGEGAPAMIRPSLVERARSILYEADRQTYGGAWEFLVHRSEDTPPIEYRVAVVNREYQVTLVRLVDVMNEAGRFGFAVWIEL